MISILEFFGEKYKDVRLKDDNSETGGILHSDETLDEFMSECGINPEDDIVLLSKALSECGVKFLI